MRLSDLQRQLHAVVRGEATVEDGAKGLGVDPRRLGIYRAFAQGHVRTALHNVYEVTQATLAAGWDSLVLDYTAAHPPSHWTLNAAAESFPAFLEGVCGQRGVEPFHVALAQFEWEQYAVLVDSAETDPPEPGAQGLNPTLSLLQLPYPVVPFIVAGDFTAPPPASEPGLALLWRHPGSHNCVYRHGADDLLLAIKIVHEGLDLEAVAAAVGQPVEAVERVLDHASQIGLILRA